MKKYLFISNSSKPSSEKSSSREPIQFGDFTKPCVDTAYELGYEVWVGVNREKPEELSVKSDYPIHLYDSHTYRSLFAFKDNMQAYKNCMNVLKQGDFDVIHCNTPIGGVIGRFCGKRAKVRKIIYTAHGFHFYKGAPLLNCTVLKWAEMFMAHYTDAIITINQEDYERAQKFHLRNQGNVYYVPGVGIDTSQYIADKQLRTYKRNELGVEEGDIVLISVGELNSNKNHQVIISALGEIQNKKIHYFLCGVGDKEEDLKRQSKKCGIEENVHFLGYRTDVKQLLNSSDIFVIPSKREGLSRAMMEAMASGLPCIASRIRGNVDLLENGEGGYLVEVQDVHGIADKIRVLSGDKELREKMKKANLERIKKFDVKVVKKTLEEIYREALG